MSPVRPADRVRLRQQLWEALLEQHDGQFEIACRSVSNFFYRRQRAEAQLLSTNVDYISPDLMIRLRNLAHVEAVALGIAALSED
ncbi:MAG: hypothetical protein ACKVHE_05810 [Planctomycetales bacterium]